MYKELLEQLLKAINNFYKREFGVDDMYESIDDIPTIIPVAVSNTEDEKHETQSNFNLSKMRWEEYIDEKLMLVSERYSLEDFIHELNCIDYDIVVSDILFMAENLDDVDYHDFIKAQKVAPQRFEVRTGDGCFRVTESEDHNYPGVDVEFVPDDEGNEDLSNPRVLFEKPIDGHLQVFVWNDKNSEDFTEKIKFAY